MKQYKKDSTNNTKHSKYNYILLRTLPKHPHIHTPIWYMLQNLSHNS